MASVSARGPVSGAIPASSPLSFPASREESGFMSAMPGCSSSSFEVKVVGCSHHLLQPRLPEDWLRPQRRLGERGGVSGCAGRWFSRPTSSRGGHPAQSSPVPPLPPDCTCSAWPPGSGFGDRSWSGMSPQPLVQTCARCIAQTPLLRPMFGSLCVLMS